MVNKTKQVVKLLFNKLGYDIKKLPEQSASIKENIMSYPLSYRLMIRVLYFLRLFEMIKDIDGDVVECGIGHGHSFLILAFMVKEELKGRKLWGFDSFEGFPHPLNMDISPRNAKKGEWSDTSIQSIISLLRTYEIDENFIDSQITIVKGFFNESLKKYRGSEIALLHIDVDLYESYHDVLRELYPVVTKGGLILFDEYMETGNLINFPGAQKAIDEYLGERISEFSRDRATGKYYLVKK